MRWDPLLVRELARELHSRLAGARARGLHLDGRSRRFTLFLREGALRWDLHPSGGAVLLLPPEDPVPGHLPLPGLVRGVEADVDERVLRFFLLPERSRPARELVVELLANQWNALVVERPSGTVRHVLVTRGPPRPVRVGSPYLPPPPNRREGASAPLPPGRWLEILDPVPPPQRARELVDAVAWTSPLNAQLLVGDSERPDRRLLEGHALWVGWVFGAAAVQPGIARRREGWQPYPWPLPGGEWRAAASLLDALRLAGEVDGASASASDAGLRADTAEQVRGLERALEGHRRRATRLQAALDGVPDPGVLRAQGDLLLARFPHVAPGTSRVTLTGFTGEAVTVELDPALPVQANAQAFYAAAAKAARALERLPPLLEGAQRACRELEDLLARVRSGDASPEEVQAALPRREERSGSGDGGGLPYRTFRSSGGLEIRVGRGARHNDDLTFRHSAPDDVWLHARHAQGAHVILRWGGPGIPPARDLEEAAGLAALHSKARTSGVVPVDWALRKHVRKPRGAPPGSVVPQRVRTVMARPDASLLERLSTD